MAITNRNLKGSERLVGKYRGKEHAAEVVKTRDGLRYRLADGTEYKSPSGVGAAIFGKGRTCNGWAFGAAGSLARTLARRLSRGLP